ncbi:lipid IV(A) 3-deoxy-D-manno-octulosonic acid transferase [Alcanivorax sp. DG881]|jgi:3-deoxy-D-manno-octulosonic-acid transferase|uniref:lipid IV(A) 3-deoxy-D-manno-octulosonic acid transferase n=1 Tax=Alcanivorax sp. DG881 TaxID=236097 RepID=UPI00017ECC37|nr:lipid IV(A) 3-deoxy-D-manno-octulosonic acid transferase [Alcanivorax sp. DG881]EDX88994.1 3-deoxy-D-manno-octulosonic-acid transferase subfamily, putative [Alcanivorax sp. DG881]
MRTLYSFLWYLLLPFLFLRLWLRGRKAPAYRLRWKERMAWGYRPGTLKNSLWVHAVSVGETLAAAPLIERLLADYPDVPLLVTTTTPTGSERVQALFGDRVTHVYCPWELPTALTRFMRAFDPQLVIVLETELWPNLCAAVKRHGAKLMLMNGRLSEKSYRGYGKLPRLIRPMMARFDALAVQTRVEAERYMALGAWPERVYPIGSVKFDMTLDTVVKQAASQLRVSFGDRPVWIAASTHPGEDAPVLAAHKTLRAQKPDALLILVPRHPERFDGVADQVREAGLSVARRSQQEPAADAAVYLADTMGELLMLFGACDVAFVGGSLVPVGGHNLLEPAAWEKPVLTGPHLHNFTAIAQLLDDAGGLSVVDSGEALGDKLQALMSDPDQCTRQGQAAAAVVEANRGALEKGLELIAMEMNVGLRPSG